MLTHLGISGLGKCQGGDGMVEFMGRRIAWMVAGVALGLARAQAPASVRDGIYSIDQARRGDRPGRLSPEQNAMLLAYILTSNKYPSGSGDLPADADRLRLIRFEAALGK